MGKIHLFWEKDRTSFNATKLITNDQSDKRFKVILKQNDPKWLSAAAPALYTCMKARNNVSKIGIQEMFSNLQQMVKITWPFC